MATKSTVLKDKDGTSLYPVTDVSLVVGLQEGAIMKSVVVSQLPTADATTVGTIYMVPSATVTGEYDRYMTTYSNSAYTWTQLGSTAIPSPVIADNLTTNDATQALSAKQGKVLNDNMTQLGQEVDDLENEAVITRGNEDAGDLSFSDEDGNVLVKFADGHIETKHFNSKNIRELIDTADSPQFYIVDENGNAILEVINGHIKTKNFDSSIGVKRYGNFSILGDSWSAMKGYIKPTTNAFWYPSSDPDAQGRGYNNDVETPEQMWWYIFANQYGIRLIQNNSWSGSRIANSSANPQSSFLNRMDDLGDVPELIIVFGTRNDDNNTQLGNYKYSDWTESDLETYRPAVAKLLDTLLKTYIGAKILFVCNSANSDKKTSAETVCEHYGIPFLQIDLTNEQVTGGHPNSSGMSYISNQIINKLTTI